MQRVVIIDYGSGNLRSAAKALERAAGERALPAEVHVSDDAREVRAADRLVLPGVGAFADCWRGLNALPDVVPAMTEAVWSHGRPFLGICVGMQLLATRGLEYGETPGLDWIPGEVVALAPDDPHLKVPHMGWNELIPRQSAHPLLAGLPAEAHAYFVHSFRLRAERDADVLATTDYGGPVTAMIGRANIAGTQFHPEKSQATGLHLLGNFLEWRP
jgi:glutamine amidotransferase